MSGPRGPARSQRPSPNFQQRAGACMAHCTQLSHVLKRGLNAAVDAVAVWVLVGATAAGSKSVPTASSEPNDADKKNKVLLCSSRMSLPCVVHVRERPEYRPSTILPPCILRHTPLLPTELLPLFTPHSLAHKTNPGALWWATLPLTRAHLQSTLLRAATRQAQPLPSLTRLKPVLQISSRENYHSVDWSLRTSSFGPCSTWRQSSPCPAWHCWQRCMAPRVQQIRWSSTWFQVREDGMGAVLCAADQAVRLSGPVWALVWG